MTNDNLYASAMKGFCSIRVCWQFLHDVSGALEQLHTSKKAHGSVDLNHVRIQGEHFELTDGTNDSTPESDIWALAASAMELVLGSPIFNGEGEVSQSANTPIPSLPHPSSENLNALLHKCLDNNTGNRPSASEIMGIAQKELDGFVSQGRKPRIHPSAQTQETLNKTDRQWPEQMTAGLSRVLLFLLTITLSTLASFGQIPIDKNQDSVVFKLMDAVLILRQDSKQSWDSAQAELEKLAPLFTLMNELQDQRNDCGLIGGQVESFRVNRMVTELKKEEITQNPMRELLDGSDTRFNYSLFEKGIKKGCTATYTLTGRSGRQVFLVIPFSANQSYTVELRKKDGTVLPISGKDSNGITYYLISTQNGPDAGESLTLRISNKDTQRNASFVIINHNYRNKR
jgi:hypothetical protein